MITDRFFTTNDGNGELEPPSDCFVALHTKDRNWPISVRQYFQKQMVADNLQTSLACGQSRFSTFKKATPERKVFWRFQAAGLCQTLEHQIAGGLMVMQRVQRGTGGAEYGKRVLPDLAKRLTSEFGKGFSAPSLWGYRQFHLEFPILSTVWRELSWSHFRMLLRVKDEQARTWYANEAVTQGWSVRAL